MSLSTLVALTAQVTTKNSVSSSNDGPPSIQQVLDDGVALGQCDIAYVAARTIANSGSPDSIDLRGGGLIGTNKAVVSFVKVVLIIIISQSGNDANIITAGGGSNSPAWFPSQQVGGNGSILLKFDPSLAGYAVTAGTGDIIQVAAAAGTNVPYSIFVAGRSS